MADGVESERWEAPSDPRQLMPQTGGEDAFHFLHDKVQGGKQSAEELQGNQNSSSQDKACPRRRSALPCTPAAEDVTLRTPQERTPLSCLQEMSGKVEDAFQPPLPSMTDKKEVSADSLPQPSDICHSS